MIKILLLFFIMIFSISCSMDTHSGLWNEKFNEVKLSNTKVEDIDKNISFEDFKNKIVNYGKNSSFPSLDD